jgi:M3 family oligoendopeptidase
MNNLEHSIEFNMDTYENEFLKLLDNFKSSQSYEKQQKCFIKINQMRFTFESTLNYLRLLYHRELNNDTFREKYINFSKLEPRYLKLVNDYYHTIINTDNRKEFEHHFGNQLFRLADIKLSTYSSDISIEIEKENQLMFEFEQLHANSKVNFQDRTFNLSTITPFLTDKSRKIRKLAHLAKSEFYKENEDLLDELLDELVKTRHSIAEKLGYSSFIELGYHRLNRTSHNEDDLKKYRHQVKTDGVPFISKLKIMQRERIGVDQLKFYDEPYVFPHGMPMPRGTKAEIQSNLKKMFTELSPQTSQFFEYMLKNRLIDSDSRENKIGENYTTFIGEDKSPYIFTNFHGTSNDIRVFAHEAGHAFQFYMSQHWNIPEYLVPYDSCEIFSFTMERLTWPWMELFFGEETYYYKFAHLTNAFMFMPIASVIDEFEHYLYKNPTVSFTERKKRWRQLEKEYLPERDYDNGEFLESGTSFYDFAHLFISPFYFMDYDLAHFCSVQLWEKSQTQPKAAWDMFLEMCRHGGHHSFNEHLNSANLYSPFEEGSLKRLLSSVEDWINKYTIN